VLYPPWWVAQNETLAAEQERQQAASFPPVDVVLSRIEAIMRFDRRRDLGRIRTPTLVTVADRRHGHADVLLAGSRQGDPGREAQGVRARRPHALPRGRPEYNRTVLDFLSS
jgi:hypothetical protein